MKKYLKNALKNQEFTLLMTLSSELFPRVWTTREVIRKKIFRWSTAMRFKPKTLKKEGFSKNIWTKSQTLNCVLSVVISNLTVMSVVTFLLEQKWRIFTIYFMIRGHSEVTLLIFTSFLRLSRFSHILVKENLTWKQKLTHGSNQWQAIYSTYLLLWTTSIIKEVTWTSTWIQSK